MNWGIMASRTTLDIMERKGWGWMLLTSGPGATTRRFPMLYRERLLRTVNTAVAESWKMTSGQPLSLHLEADATIPLGSATAKAELSVGVEDGEVKPKFQVGLEGLLSNLVVTATDESVSQMREQRAVYSGSVWQSKRAQASNRAGGRGHQYARFR